MNREMAIRVLINRAFQIAEQGVICQDQLDFETAGKLFAEALSQINHALSLDPMNPSAYSEKGFLLGRMGRFEEAGENCKKAIMLAPDNPKFRSNLVHVFFEEARLERTRRARVELYENHISEIEELTRQHPDYPSGYLAQAVFYAAIGKGQSHWEDRLAQAARAYFRKSFMSSGLPASEEAVALTIKKHVLECQLLQKEWKRLPA